MPGLRDLLHESDQAAVVGGAVRLANGMSSFRGADFYNYDKLFLSYWLLAAVFRAPGFLLGKWGPVTISNAISSAAFALAAGVAIARARCGPAQAARVLAVLLAPAFLVHAPFFAAASLSVAALVVAFTLLERPRRTGYQNAIASVAVFAAVGTRADAVLALPFVVWLTFWPQGRPFALLRRPLFYALISGALLALIVGRVVAGATSTTVFAPVFVPKIVAAYAAFGLGGAALIIPLIAAVLGWRGFMVRNGWRRVSALVGTALFLLPLAFYLPQLFSTRYWFLGLGCALMFLLSRRGAALLRVAPPRLLRAVTAAALVTALLLMFVGIRLPFPTRPRLTLNSPTRFPSADGLVPMGNYLGILFGRDARGEPLIADHNQAIWKASESVVFTPDESGKVPVLVTPMREILRLRLATRGWNVHPLDEDQPAQPCYADLRSLIKFEGGLDIGGRLNDTTARLLSEAKTREVSAPGATIPILWMEPTTRPVQLLEEPWRMFRAVFAGSDFRIASEDVVAGSGELKLPLGEGRTLAILASRPFSLALTARDGRVTTVASKAATSDTGAQLVVLDGRQSDAASLTFNSRPPPDVRCAAAVLPDYMSVRAFQP
jgi:hypothetical protein